MKPKLIVGILALAALAGAGALAYHLGSGARYRLYTSAAAADCWRAVEVTTLSTSTIRPVSVARTAPGAGGRTRVSIEYTMDRVLGGRTLGVTCVFAADGSPESVEFDGVALEPEALAEVERALED